MTTAADFRAVLERHGYAVSARNAGTQLAAIDMSTLRTVEVRIRLDARDCGWSIEEGGRRIASGVFASSLAETLARLGQTEVAHV